MQVQYRPAGYVLERLRGVDFVAVVGPTAVGKTTLIKAAIEASPSLHMLVGGTSRGARPGEHDGVDFHFGDLATMQARMERGEYVTAVFGAAGDLYTTAMADYPTDKIVLLATLAEAIPMFRALPFRSFRTIFILPPSLEIWRERLGLHNFTSEQLERRLKEAKSSLQFALEDERTQFVISSDLDVAIADFLALSLDKPISERLQADQSRAHALVRSLINSLKNHA